MTWVIWRQHRGQGLTGAAILAAFTALLLVTGLKMASQWDTALAQCAPAKSCGDLSNTLSLGGGVTGTLVLMTVVAPLILGLFWGAPLVAREIESGTSTFAWTQSTTRRRWLTAKTGWILLAAGAWGGAMAALVTWWLRPVNALYQNRFDPGYFDVQGIVPVGYALFAVALGIAAGTILRRSLAALAVTLGTFAGLRMIITFAVRQHYLSPVTATFNILGSYSPAGAYWLLSQGVINPSGQVTSGHAGAHINGVPVTSLPASCQNLIYQQLRAGSLSKIDVRQCLAAAHLRSFITYQPASRYWSFQWIETGIFVALAAALIAITFVVVSRRDA